MKDQILKIAKVKSEKEFYKKFPTEEAFMKAHGKQLKKAAMGKAMVYDQLHQLTDFGNPPIAQYGIGMTSKPQDFSKYLQGTNQFGLNPNGTIKQVGDAFSNSSMAQMSGQQMASNMSSQFATPSADTLLGVNEINAEAGGGGKGANVAAAAIGALPGIIAGIDAIGSQRKAINKAYQARELSELNLQANSTREKVKRKYVRPEDNIIQPGQMGNPYGSGTNFLAKNGKMIGGNPTEIQNMYNPGDIYTDAGYEPIESQKLKQYKQGGDLPEAAFGDYFQSSGQAQIGSAAGTAIGSLVGGPLGGAIGGLIGTVGGNLLGGAKQARELEAEKKKAEMNTQQAAYQQTMQNQFGAYMEQGGKVDVGDEYKWVSHTWQPQTIAKFGEYNVKDLLKPPHDADMLRSGGHLKDEYYTPPSAEALFTGRPERKPLTMEDGGKFAMGGDLEVIEGGKAETISYNPFLPDGGETVMFKGRSHDNGGIPINFGENGVEVEGGEPAVKLRDGGNESNMVVFGNMKLSKMAADEFGIPDAKGKKFKHVANEISKVEKKQNKLIDKATERADMTTGSSGFDQLKMNTSQAQLMGANMKLRSAAILKQNLGAVQNAILDTASELGVKSDELAQGKLVKEKDPRMMAQTGTNIPYSGTPFSDAPDLYPGPTPRELVTSIVSDALKGVPPMQEYTQIPYQPEFGSSSELPDVTVTSDKLSSTANLSPISDDAPMSDKGKFDWKGLGQMALSNIAPFLRPRTRLGLDPEELYPEYFAMASNQLEPVQAQTFQPMLDTPMDISLNDQLNAIDAQSRAAIRAAGQNPAAQAMIMSQSLDAKNKVLGEQTRINAANKMQTYDKNRAILNDAQLKNLQILDNQYVRQAQARSNTRAQTLEALKSIAAKTAQNKLENRTLNVYENMYNYRFSPSGVAYNTNAPAQFNIPGAGGIEGLTDLDKDKIKELYEKIVSRDSAGRITGSKEKSRTTRQRRNGAIVQALKNL
jgi:outer membrane lipoprotein SlyB